MTPDSLQGGVLGTHRQILETARFRQLGSAAADTSVVRRSCPDIERKGGKVLCEGREGLQER